MVLMLTEDDKIEIGKIARENIRLGFFINDLRNDLMNIFAKYDDEDKPKYYLWSKLAHDYFVDFGNIEMMEDLVEIVYSKHEVSDDKLWKELEKSFTEKYRL
jgi:hypothetical protein